MSHEISSGAPLFFSTDSLGLENYELPSNDTIIKNGFEIDCRVAQNILEPRFPRAFEIMKKMGVHPDSGIQEFLNPVTEVVQQENFSNIGNHVCCVGLVADALATILLEAGVISSSQRDVIVERALLHDVAKPSQIFMLRAISGGTLSREAFFNPDSYFNRVISFLESRGLSNQDAQAVFYDYGSETGSEPARMMNFISADSAGLNAVVKAPLEVQLVHLADDMVGSTKPTADRQARNFILTTRERVLLTQPRDSNYIGWKVGLGLSESGEIVPISDITNVDSSVKVLGSSYGLQIWASDYAICHNIARLIAADLSIEDVARFVKSRVVEKLSQVAI